jgi:hypothetical protein
MGYESQVKGFMKFFLDSANLVRRFLFEMAPFAYFLPLKVAAPSVVIQYSAGNWPCYQLMAESLFLTKVENMGVFTVAFSVSNSYFCQAKLSIIYFLF